MHLSVPRVVTESACDQVSKDVCLLLSSLPHPFNPLQSKLYKGSQNGWGLALRRHPNPNPQRLSAETQASYMVTAAALLCLIRKGQLLALSRGGKKGSYSV